MNTPDRRYRQDCFLDLFVVLMCLLASFLAVLFLGFVIFFKKPPPLYLQLTPDNQITEDLPLDKPNLPQNAVLSWVTDVISNSFSFNFKNVNTVLERVRPDYSARGYNTLMNYLTNEGILSELQTRKWVYTAFALSAPQVTDERVVDGRYTWSISLPIQVQRDSIEQAFGSAWLLNVRLIRVPSLTAPLGFQIDDFKVEDSNYNATVGSIPIL